MDLIYAVSVWLLPVLIALLFMKRLMDTLPASLVMIRHRAWDVLVSIRFGT